MKKPNDGSDFAEVFRRYPRTLGGQKAALDKEPHRSLFMEVIEYAEAKGLIPVSDAQLHGIMKELCEARGFMVIQSPTTFLRYISKHPEIARRIGRG